MLDPLCEAFMKDCVWHFASYIEFKNQYKTIEEYEKAKKEYKDKKDASK